MVFEHGSLLINAKKKEFDPNYKIVQAIQKLNTQQHRSSEFNQQYNNTNIGNVTNDRRFEPEI